ncbi:carbamate kinase [Desulfobacula toluolica]|uniref:Carbamate kinase n=1 Tax=Desulfobacula toluolica (strain DSM 7467 / Tol2) TaxID=651182 RepID=K0NHW3_DESTT|nr:carbamate kinase [Desulfobacula toluolica]CCK80951.1 CpkA: carbamate kinase [Desulfobacula toluolica Tol2]
MIDSDNRKPILLVALGGNAMIKKGQEGTAVQQRDNLKVTVRQIARLSQTHRIIITHGNGPQVGNLLLQQECCDAVPKMPLEILVAQTQGQIGYMIESCLDSELMAQNLNASPLVSLISYVVVDEHDPAFKTPTKPIGPVYTKTQAEAASWPFHKTAKGYRRVTFSPKPVTIVEKHEIKQLIDMDFIVICCGGGGIPVIREGRAFSGIEAVIDKDLASARLAVEVGADLFVIATDVKGVATNFGQKNQKILRTLTLADARKHMRAGHFPEGSMKPKVEAAMQFVGIPGKRAVIAFLEEIEQAVAGKAGTEFVA